MSGVGRRGPPVKTMIDPRASRLESLASRARHGMGLRDVIAALEPTSKTREVAS